MRQLTLVWVLLFSCFLQVHSSIDFEECGGELVTSVEITGCIESPCILRRGGTHNIFITMDYIHPVVDSVSIYSDISQYGAVFRQNTIVNNPCIYGCPVTTALSDARFDINVRIGTKLVGMPGLMEVNGSYYKGQSQVSGFCVMFMVDII